MTATQAHPVPDDTEIERKVSDLDLTTKIKILTGRDFWTTWPVESIGLRPIVMSDGPAGVRGENWDEREPSANFPSGSALGATWSRQAAARYGALLAAEARRKGVDVVLGPTINLHRSPLGGRHFESLSEDPQLTSVLATEYVRALQSEGIAACPKHYVGNEYETERFTASSRIDERALREVYLAAFEGPVIDGGAWSIMSAYNSVNGTTMSEHPLLTAPLKTGWEFDGVIISDWTGVRSTVASAQSGQDLAMPGPFGFWGEQLLAAVHDGTVSESTIDEKVRRLIRLAFRVGAFDVRETQSATAAVPASATLAAKELSIESSVMLVNNGVLPLPAAVGTIAVLGRHAVEPRTQGGGSATVLPGSVSTPVDALRRVFSVSTVRHSIGIAEPDTLIALDPNSLTDPSTGDPGLRVEFTDADGELLRSERRTSCRLVWFGNAPTDAASLQVRTRYLPTGTGTLRFQASCVGKLHINAGDRTVLDTELAPIGSDLGAALLEPPAATADIEVAAGVPIDLAITYAGPMFAVGVAALNIGRERDDDDGELHRDAVTLAAASDVAIVFVGTDSNGESEGWDRSSLRLPGDQDDLVASVAAVNPRTIVVVNAGAPLIMPWKDDVAAILLTWFGGEQIGNAVADLLSGTAEPGGRLPTTWPTSEEDVPVLDTTPQEGVVDYREGIHVGYRGWLRQNRTPAYSFGFGLSYTSFEIDRMSAVTSHAVDVTVRNTGDRIGKFVAQIYAHRPKTTIDRPVRWLVGFADGVLAAGETTTTRVTLARRAFQNWDAGWHTEAGEFHLSAGFDVSDIRASVVHRVQGSS
ncbi:beta-glucosidase family protein [Rhodococcus sp. BH5]|uniref:beta-glucosidase family protein n=1 Tax=Rhodococcus sp. BH5 TaxID=2871702 RepID=UPI0022CD4BEA|nr:glycoside hydrolase family 3 C-terminal domain-containing protein [Rhodococcus sp. BH5]MCZ9635319.1 glycoside hydrolase family 3 C-terminal domain-containing protein [Rhodococcus sp. BH5]